MSDERAPWGVRLQLAAMALTGQLWPAEDVAGELAAEPAAGGPDDGSHVTGEDGLRRTTPVRRVISCIVEPNVRLRFSARRETPLGPIIGIAIDQDQQTLQSVVLRPRDIRRLAAGLLNAADEADGTTPLIFMPRGGDDSGRRKGRR